MTVSAGKCYENEGKPLAKLAVYREKSYNTAPENTARRKVRVSLESARWTCVTIIHCGCFMLHFLAYDDTSRTTLKGPLGGVFFLLKASQLWHSTLSWKSLWRSHDLLYSISISSVPELLLREAIRLGWCLHTSLVLRGSFIEKGTKIRKRKEKRTHAPRYFTLSSPLFVSAQYPRCSYILICFRLIPALLFIPLLSPLDTRSPLYILILSAPYPHSSLYPYLSLLHTRAPLYILNYLRSMPALPFISLLVSAPYPRSSLYPYSLRSISALLLISLFVSAPYPRSSLYPYSLRSIPGLLFISLLSPLHTHAPLYILIVSAQYPRSSLHAYCLCPIPRAPLYILICLLPIPPLLFISLFVSTQYPGFSLYPYLSLPNTRAPLYILICLCPIPALLFTPLLSPLHTRSPLYILICLRSIPALLFISLLSPLDTRSPLYILICLRPIQALLSISLFVSA